VIDTVTFPALVADQAYGRATDGTGDWQVETTPTPGAQNP
jgi:hypothetical protein